MKRLLYSIFFSMYVLSMTAQSDCCPKFQLFSDYISCSEDKQKGEGEGKYMQIQSCLNSSQNYIVSPNMPGFNFTWEIEGGTPSTTSGHNIQVEWGSISPGKIKVYIESVDGLCKDTINVYVQLQKAPTAGFDISTDTVVCRNEIISFTNTSIGANDYYWDFGDGTSSTQINPSHSYSNPGTYTVTLVARDRSAGERPDVSDKMGDCGCSDTYEMIITVLPEQALQIESDCKEMLCYGDVATYFTPADCDSYNWSVKGGTIIGSATNKEIKVVWDGTYPATVTLVGECGSVCGDSTTISVPVLYPTMDIEGSEKVCINSNGTYSLPTMPGTIYNWTITGAGNHIVGASKNTSSINVKWGYQAGDYRIECKYFNPHTNCEGKATIEVKVVPPFYIYGSQKVCVGSSFIFSTISGDAEWEISPNAGYTPSSFANGNSISGTWTQVGEYTVKAVTTTPNKFCNEESELIIEVVEKPTIDSLAGPHNICPGGTYVYIGESTSNEGWYQWIVNGGVITSYMGSHNDSISVKWNSVGPYSIYASFHNGICISPAIHLDVEPVAPPVIDGNPLACMDEVAVYTTNTSAPTGGFEWTLSNALGTILSGQGTDSIQVLWHGSLNNNTSVLTLTTCGGNTSLNITVNIPDPIVITSSGSFCDTNGKTLTASISGASSYGWTLDDSPINQNGQTITITQAGKYKVKVINTDGCVSEATLVVPEEDLNLSAALSTQDKYIWDCEEDVNTTLHAIPSIAELCYQWYRANNPNSQGAPIAGATSPDYTATSPGFYWASISVCNTSCVENTDTIQVIKLVCDTVCDKIDDYTATIINSDCNPMTFTGTTNPPEALQNVYWYFGDGKEAFGTQVAHHYRDTAVYKVCATFWADAYCAITVCKDIEINIVADFNFSVDCDQVTFTNTSKSRYPILSYQWTFDGGVPTTSNAENPVVTFAQAGEHIVTLTITDGTCTTTYERKVITHGATAQMNVPDPLCAKTDAPFTASSGNPDLTYNWDFGDGFTSNLQNVTHAYQSSGSYTVTLTTMDEMGCTKTNTQQVTVNPEPVINIGVDLEICKGDSIQISGPSGFDGYQWYRNGSAISGANSQSYYATNHGEYWVQASNGEGCMANSNHVNVTLKQSPVASIVANKMICSNSVPFVVYNNDGSNPNYQYNWSISGPASGTITPGGGNSANVDIPSKTPGNYQIVLEVTDGNSGCAANDTICIYLSESPVLTVEAPAGDLCAGEIHTFVAHATPDISPNEYIYMWSNGHVGDTLRTGKPGIISVTALSPNGCSVSSYVAMIKALPNVSLAPVGCDTLCVTDTIYLPLPQPSNMSYNVTWYDDDGTAIATVGNDAMLPLFNLHPGIHHLYAEVSYGSGCVSTSGIYHLYVEDCSLPKVCEPCDELLDTATATQIDLMENSANTTIYNYNITFTIKKEVQEVRISLSNLNYEWNDTTCIDCNLQVIERGCMSSNNQNIGSLQLQANANSNSDCSQELVWKGSSILAPGTYTVAIKVTLPKSNSKDCKLIIDETCFHLTLVDDNCQHCESIICAEGLADPTEGGGTESSDEDCDCNLSGEWTSLYMIPQKPGIPKITRQILCNTVLDNVATNTPYVLSGVYNCFGDCISVKNEIVVYNQMNQIIYTREVTTLNETISFPAKGAYTIMLTATCGEKKCVCTFRINVSDNPTDIDGNDVPPTGTPDDIPPFIPTLPPDLPAKIDSVVGTIIPKDFNGGILVAKDDSVIYEKYVSYKHEVNKHTAFDIASITKPFTASAILKLMEEGKLNLEDAVDKYLPKFPYPEITISMLLSHRSGLMDYLHFIDASGWDKTINVTNNDLLNIIANNKSKVLITKPGSVYKYSNTNYSLLAMIVEKVSGSSYANYLDLNFFMPLQMKDSYVVDINNFARSTQSYYKNGTTYQLRYLDMIYGDKCVYSSTDDLKKWDTALRGGKVLKQSSLDLAKKTIGEPLAFNSSYTMGWKKMIASNGKEFLYHDGWWAGNRALLIRLIDENVVIVVLSNNNFTTIKDIRKLCDLFGDYQMSSRGTINF